MTRDTETGSAPHLAVSREAGVVTVRMNRPEKRNAIGLDTFAELERIAREVSVNPEDRVVVLEGSDGFFSAGGELARQPDGGTAPPSSTGAGLRNMKQIVGGAILALHRTPQPVVAAVDGYAIGAGLSLALACDLVVATTRASFALPFVSRGLGPDCGLSWTLQRNIGLHKAMEMALLGSNLTAEQAMEVDMVNLVVEPDELNEAVHTWTRQLVATSATALATTKQALHFAASSTFAEALDHEAMVQVISGRSGEVRG